MVKVWNINNSESKGYKPSGCAVSCLDWSYDGSLLASGADSNIMLLKVKGKISMSGRL